jgi:DNA polymerase III subunit chi
MTEILFYHLHSQSLDQVLPALLERSLERGWRVAVQVGSEERIEALDALLWTYRDDAFLPHGTYRDSEAAAQPILLTLNDDNTNLADVRFLLDGAHSPSDAATYRRIVVVFDGDDREAAARAHERWEEAKARGFEPTYWQLDAEGRWNRKV